MDDAVTGESDGGARSARGVLPLAFLTLSAFLLNTSEFIPVGLLSDIADAFSLSESGAGLMITIYAWAVAALSLPLMIAASRLAPRRLILAVLAVFAVGQLASACAPSFPALAASLLALGPTAPVVLGPLAAGPLAVCVVWGLCATAFNVAAQAEVIHVTDQDASAVAMSIFSGLFNVGVGAGSVIGGMVCDGPGIALVGVVGGVVAGAGALWSVTGLARRLATVDR